jgi:hypothetical protein
LFLGLSAGLVVAVAAYYWLQPDLLAALSLVPAWCWLPLGVILLMLGYTRRDRRASVVAGCLWLFFAGLFVDELRSLTRGVIHQGDEQIDASTEGQLRVISLNCYVGSEAMREVLPFEPDIVFFQESPNHEAAKRIAKELFGDEAGLVWSSDTSIVARGTFQARVPGLGSPFVLADLVTPAGDELTVASLRLAPPSFRVDFWSPSAWANHRAVRMKHRIQIAELMDSLQDVPTSTAIVIGGDFNTTPRDAALWPLRERFRDTFRVAGQGWGNTGTNTYPLWRVDQIWVSEQFDVECVRAHKTVHSDHRMVVCDLVLRRE